MRFFYFYINLPRDLNIAYFRIVSDICFIVLKNNESIYFSCSYSYLYIFAIYLDDISTFFLYYRRASFATSLFYPILDFNFLCAYMITLVRFSKNFKFSFFYLKVFYSFCIEFSIIL
jgi:hypothetical protein